MLTRQQRLELERELKNAVRYECRGRVWGYVDLCNTIHVHQGYWENGKISANLRKVTATRSGDYNQGGKR